jgi:hypothetical protein
MVTLAALKLTVDATGLQQGIQQQAVPAMKELGTEAEATTRKLDTVGRNGGASMEAAAAKALKLNRAIEAVGEVTQVGSRVRLLGEEIRGLGSGFGSAAGVATALSGALIDVAQISEKTGGSLSALAVVLRANPILAAAGVISLIASAMSLFGSNTRETNEELSRQVQLQKQLADATTDIQTRLQRNADLRTAGFGTEPGADQRLRAEQLVQVATGLSSRQGIIQQGELSAVSGISTQELLQRAGPFGRTNTPFLGATFSPDQARTVLLAIASELRQQSEEIVNREATTAAQRVFQQGEGIRPGLYGPQLPPGGIPGVPQAAAGQFPNVLPITGGVGYGSAIGPSPAGLSPFEQGLVSNQIADAARAAAEFEERLRTLRDLGNDVGSALGAAFGSLVFNVNNGRQALAGLLQQLAAIGQQQIVRGFGNAVANLFTPSAGQIATSNPLMNPGAIGPQLPS